VKQQNRSWLALLAFCTTTALVTALAFAILVASATLAFAIGQSLRSGKGTGASRPAASSTTYSGMLTDSRCKARHPMNSGKSTAECVRACVRKGSHYVLVDGDKIYALKGNRAELDQRAGQRVTIAGVLGGNTINVSSVGPERLAAK
jgi:hypothetical protein